MQKTCLVKFQNDFFADPEQSSSSVENFSPPVRNFCFLIYSFIFSYMFAVLYRESSAHVGVAGHLSVHHSKDRIPLSDFSNGPGSEFYSMFSTLSF